MNVRHSRAPVTETLPPFIFMFWRIALPDYGYTVLLWKNGHYLTVQFPSPTEPFEDLYDHIDAEVKQLKSHAKSLVFGKTNWVYFLRNQDGKRALAYRQRPKRRIVYQPFTQVVHESELTYLRPISANLVEGIWRGQQGALDLPQPGFWKLTQEYRTVDAYIGVDDMSHRFIGMQMKGKNAVFVFFPLPDNELSSIRTIAWP